MDSEDLAILMRTTRAIMQSGFVPVPVIAARRVESAAMLCQYLAELRSAGASERVVVVGGDPAQPRGPYADAASVVRGPATVRTLLGQFRSERVRAAEVRRQAGGRDG